MEAGKSPNLTVTKPITRKLSHARLKGMSLLHTEYFYDNDPDKVLKYC